MDRSVVMWASLLVSAMSAGCGGPQRVPVYTVSGSVFVNGRPAESADVYFHPRSSIPGLLFIPVTRVDANGTFQPGTHSAHDGLPAGEYALTIQWPKRTIVEGEEVSGDDQLRGRFKDPARPAATFTVQEGVSNVIPPLELTAK